jgi:hypothetical protein
VAVAACGDDGGDSSAVSEPGVSEEPVAGEPSGGGPQGPLTSSGIGEAQRGDSTAEVRELFGEPDREQTGPGCELAPDSKGALAWTYRLDDGIVVISFDAASGELGSYRNTGPGLETTLGDTVGEPFKALRANWGGSLEPLDLGTGPTAKAGIWLVKDGPEAELLFEVRGGRVAAISGGHIEICE